MIAGADWFEGRWLAVMEDPEGINVRLVPEFSDFLEWPSLELLVIDIPIGLPDCGARQCDRQARRAIRPRGSSVFPAPIRPVLKAGSQIEASQIRYSVEGKRCSAQAFGIYPIIGSVDRHMSPDLQMRIREGHPELSFACMNGGSGLRWPKRHPEGYWERRDLLNPHFHDLQKTIASLRPQSAVIDLLDALSMLWTARRVRSGKANSIPDPPEYDSRGLRMEMVA